MRTGILTLAGFLAMGGLVCGSADATAVDPPDFSGHWRLNASISDDPVRVLGEAMQADGDRLGGGRGMRGSGMRGGGAGDMRGDPGADGTAEDRKRRITRMAENMRKSQAHLEIFHEGDEFNITNGQGLSQVLTIGSTENRIWTARGEMTAVAAYQGASLVISMKPNRKGPGTTRTYLLSEDGERLTVIEERYMPRMDRPVRLKSVYDRVEAKAPKTPDNGKN